MVVLGSKGVGKTSLVQRFVSDSFSEEYLTTIGLNVSMKKMHWADEDGHQFQVQLLIYDVAAEEAFEDLFQAFSQGTQASFLVFDTTRHTTYENIGAWYKRLHGISTTVVAEYLIGNKVDLVDSRSVTTEEGEWLARDLKLMGYIETSAKTSHNVEIAFSDIARKLVEKAHPPSS
jgi:small GTP-binding protein